MKLVAFLRLNTLEALLLAVVLTSLYLLGIPFDRLLANLPQDHAPTVALYEAGVRWFVSLALAGWVASLLGRMPWPLLVCAAAVVALWSIYWIWLQPVARPLTALGEHRLAFTALAVSLFFSAWLLAFALRIRAPNLTGWLVMRGPATAIAYPGFVLFTGLGFLWLMDLFVNGHYSGVLIKSGVLQGSPMTILRVMKLAQDLSVAFFVLTLLGVLAPALMRWMLIAGGALSKRLTRLDLRLLGLLATALAILGCGAIWLFFRVYLKLDEDRQVWTPRLSEAVRIPLLLGLGYVFYRWLEAGERISRGFWWAFTWLGAFAALAFMAFGEKGQSLIALAMLLMLALAAKFEYGFSRNSARRRFAPLWTLLCTLAVLATVIWVLHSFGGLFGSHINDRLAAMNDPASAREDFLTILRWFSSESGLSGFGLGQVPWCGYVNNLGDLCRKETGVPFQIESDYAFFGLVGVWGTVGALLICAGLMAWLLALLITLLPSSRVVLNLALLQGWLVGVWTVVMIVQVCLTVLGGLGQFVLTGVPLPMMATGLASIASIAFFVGLASSQVDAYSR